MSDTGKAEKNPDAPPEAPRRKSAAELPKAWPGMFLLMLIAALLGGAVAVYWPRIPGSPNQRIGEIEARLDGLVNAPSRAEATALQARLDSVEARLNALENAPPQAGAGAPAPGIAGVGEEMGAFELRLGMVEGHVTQADETMRAFEARIAALEADDSDAALRRAAAMLALADLSRAAMDARPFALSLDALAAVAPDDPALSELRPYAAAGAPTAAQLAARFPDAARAALLAERARTGEGIFARLWNSLARLVSVRRVGNVAGESSAARLARAESALNGGDLASAAGEAGALEGPAAASMAPWLRDARARIAIERAVEDINARIVAVIAAPPGAAP